MNSCVIADFEWCITPHPQKNSHFFYYNEILSAGAVRVYEDGTVADRFYRLIRPENAEYLHPVILDSLRLDRGMLSAADDFPTVYRDFCEFVGQTPIFSWGGADQSALTQNLNIKGSPEQKGLPVPVLRDLQPTLCKGLQIPSPYPGLAAVLNQINLENDENRHNALSDAEDTAKIVSELIKRAPASVFSLFSTENAPPKENVIKEASDKAVEDSLLLYHSVEDCLRAACHLRRNCPVCGNIISSGTWFPSANNVRMVICSCEKDGKYLCTIEARRSELKPESFFLHTEIEPLGIKQKKRYRAARRAARENRIMNLP